MACKLAVLFLIVIDRTSIIIRANENVCNTTECFKTSEFLLQNMNLDIDPCVNFYEYACGNFYRTQFLSYEMPFTSVLSKRYADYLNEIKVLLETEKTLFECESMRKAKDFYTVCMNSSTVFRVV